MLESGPLTPSNRRLATYSYLRPLVAGKRVIELGTGSGGGAAHLLGLGAASVVGVDDDPAAIERARGAHRRPNLSFSAGARGLDGAGPYDLVIVPDAEAFLRGQGGLPLSTVRRLLGPRGRLVCMVASADRQGGGGQLGGGLGYYQVVETLDPHFSRVRMFGVTPFLAYGIAEFDEAAAEGLRVDSALVDEAAVEASHYVAVAGPDDGGGLGYALVQIPPAAEAPVPPPAARPTPRTAAALVEATGDVADLRRRLAEVQGQHEGVLRVSRAQAEEIEELRGRLRRGAEARAELDEEVSRLRRALTEADESVLTLTRRTTEEMASLAQRITAGLRAAEQVGAQQQRETGPSATLTEELRRRERDLAARESALSDRDERIAALESERQDLIWRLEAAEERARLVPEEIEEAAQPPAAAPAAPAPAPADLEELRRRDDQIERLVERIRALEAELDAARRAPASGASARERELEGLLRAREAAAVQLQRAAAVHVDETTRLRDALAEQSTLVAELEEALEALSGRVAASEAEAARLRRQTQEAEAQDRARRSRLSELEGTLLRLQRQAAQPQPAAAAPEASAEAERRIGELRAEIARLEARAREADGARRELEERWKEAVERVARLERELAAKDEELAAIARDRDALRARAESAAANGDGGSLQAAVGEVSRLRGALERSEEQLWEAKGQLLIDRERITVLEHQISEMQAMPPVSAQKTVSEAAHRSILETVFRELTAIENALRTEIVEISALEREIAEWRAAVAASGTRVGAPG